MHRRDLLRWGAAGIWACHSHSLEALAATNDYAAPKPPAYSVIPVVGDGRWIWNKPPADDTGYLEPREFDVEIGIEFEGVGTNSQFLASTPVPVEFPEQKLRDVKIETNGCQAAIRKLTEGAGQLVVACPQLRRGERASAAAKMKVTLFKQYHGLQRDQFPIEQDPADDIRGGYLGDSPGIQTYDRSVRELATQLSTDKQHPWDRAIAFSRWVRRNIRPLIGEYTSVSHALKNRRGDCEEMSAVFVALCRAVGIPARLVWVPNHNWAEFYLTDVEGDGYWIPVHTASYFWFGWTGAHELVLQKGDRIKVPEKSGKERLLEDWMRYTGRQPKTKYTGRLTPVASSESRDAGPGARAKSDRGEWLPIGQHPMDKYARR